MSYIDDFNDNVVSSKIPYDDIPISRNSRRSGGSYNRKSGGFSLSGFKTLVVLVSLLFVVNVVLFGTLIYYIKHGKVDNINVYYNEINATQESISTIASNTALKSAVNIAAGGNCSDEESFYSYTLSKGAGVIHSIDEQNKIIYFVTCYHVVSEYLNDRIWVLLPTRLVPVRVGVVSYSEHFDIAVLKYNYSESNVQSFLGGCLPIQTYDSTYLSVGDKVFAVGNPLSNGFSITEGSISKINTMMTVEQNDFKTREIQTDAPINRGNSGGGLFNASGKFIGLVNSKLSSTGVEGTAYAIPGNLVLGIAESIIRNNEKGDTLHKKATYLDLGVDLIYDSAITVSFVEVLYQNVMKTVRNYTVVVDSINVGSIAKGKLKSGDVIESITIYVYSGDDIVQKTIPMYNKYIFEDYSFSIVENTTIKINVAGSDEPVEILVNENDLKTID